MLPNHAMNLFTTLQKIYDATFLRKSIWDLNAFSILNTISFYFLKVVFECFKRCTYSFSKSFLKSQTSDAPTESAWQWVATCSTTSDNKWQWLIKRMARSDNYLCNEWQRVTKNDNKWQQIANNDKEWSNEWQQVVQCVTTSNKKWY